MNSPIHVVRGKTRVLELLRAGTIAHEAWEARIESRNRYGDVAVVMGSEVARNSPEGPPLRRRVTNCWRSEGGSWRLIARHANLVGDVAG